MLTFEATTSTEPLSRLRRLIIMICAFVGLSAGYSSTYLYTAGLFLIPVAAQFGLTRGQASLGPLFCTLTAAAVTPLLGQAVDRFTALPVALLSLAGLAAGFLLLANGSDGLGSYIGLSVFLAILGSGSTGLPFSKLVLTAFERHRGAALGFVMAGSGFGALVMPPMLMPVIQNKGWRAGYEWLAIAPLAATILLAIALLPIRRSLARAAPHAPSPEGWPDDQRNRSLWRSYSFRTIAGMFFLLAIASVGLVVHFVPILIESGASAVQAAKVAGLIGLASIGGRLLMGFLLDRLPVNRLAIHVVIVAMLCTLLLLLDAGSFGIPAALMLGIVMGAESDLLAFYAVRYFPEGCYGSAFGSIFGLYLLGGAIGPSLVAYLFDLTRGYQAPLSAITALFLAALFTGLRIPVERSA